MADMLVLMEDNQGLEELNIPAIGAGIHALADRSQDYILSGLCEEYSEATDRIKENAEEAKEQKVDQKIEKLEALLAARNTNLKGN